MVALQTDESRIFWRKFLSLYHVQSPYIGAGACFLQCPSSSYCTSITCTCSIFALQYIVLELYTCHISGACNGIHYKLHG
jgi:hypothetical protein